MASKTRLSIVVLYSHALLGEGIGQMLSAEPGVAVSYVSCGQPDPLGVAARHRPDMLVVERCGCFDAPRLLEAFPEALVIDIGLEPGPTVVYRRQEIPGDPLAILQLVRILEKGHPPVALAGAGHPSEVLAVTHP